jgi:VRR-NUC domain
MANPFEKFLSAEDREHIRVVNYIKDKLPEVMAFHVPAEGNKSAFERYKHNLFGNLKGIPDFVFLHPKYKSNESKEIVYLGLFIELKAPEHKRIVMKGKEAGKIVKSKGKLSDDQKEILDKLNQMGYKAVCCFGAEESIKVIDEYFKEFYELKKILNKNRFKK